MKEQMIRQIEGKKAIRKRMSEMRNELSIEKVEQYSNVIGKLVTSSAFYQECQNICVYQAFRNEVSCEPVIKQAFLDNKKVFVPVTDMESKTMNFYQITADTDWKEGNYGIMEPVLTSDTPILQNRALILMPGLVFDKNKHRIGYGGGYYDKYLEQNPIHVTAALCYAFQVLDVTLPYEEHDILPDYIVTENRIF